MVDLCHILPIFTESKISTILLCAPGFQGAAEENLVVREKQQPSAAGAATSTVEDSNVCETLVAAVALTELNHSALKSLKKVHFRQAVLFSSKAKINILEH